MDERLIEEIVKRVLSKMRPLLAAAVSDDNHTLILLNYVDNIEKTIEEIAGFYGQGRMVRVLMSKSVADCNVALPVNMQLITIFEAIKITWKRVVLPTCSLSTLSKLALGIKDNELTEMAARALKFGIPLEICTGYMDLPGFKNKAYRMLFEDYLRRVRGFGAVIKENYCSQIITTNYLADKSTEPPVPESNEYRLDNRFISEKQTRNLPDKAIMILRHGAIISPLSNDLIKSKQIQIRYEQ